VTAVPARVSFAGYWCLVAAPEQTGQSVREREEQAIRRALAQVNAFTVRQILAKQRGRCAICGRRLGNKCHIDQIIPLAAGGSYAKSNLQIVHPMCNYRRHANDTFVLTMISIRTDTPARRNPTGPQLSGVSGQPSCVSDPARAGLPSLRRDGDRHARRSPS
jgi:hypothetical protein